MKRFLTVILLIAVATGVIWLLTSFIRKGSVSLPSGPMDDTPNPNNVFTNLPTSDVGKNVYSAYGNATRYTLNLNTVDTPAKDALLGKITGEKLLGDQGSEDVYYVLDDKYLVVKALVKFSV